MMEAGKKHYCVACERCFSYASLLKQHEKTKGHNILAERFAIQRSSPASSSMTDNFDSDDSDDEENCLLAEPMEVDPAEDSEHSNDSDDDTPTDLILSEMNGFSHDHNEYHPFPSKVSALMFLLSKGLKPVSETILNFAIHCCKELDPHTPSLCQLKSIVLPGYTSPQKFYSPNGTPFHVRVPSAIISLCFSNLETAQMMTRYPVYTEGSYMEMYEANRWHEDPLYQAPMAICDNGLQVFQGDIVRYEHEGEPLCAKVIKFLKLKQSGTLSVDVNLILRIEGSENEYVVIPVEAEIPLNDIVEVITDNIPMVKEYTYIKSAPDADMVLLNEQEWKELISVHPTKTKAGGIPVFNIPLVLYSDDTSGSKSKKWNKFDVWALLFAGLPREENSKMKNIHLLSTSNQVSALEMAEPIVNDLRMLEQEGIEVYDASLRQRVRIIAPVICMIGDNPRLAELLNLAGCSAIKYCRLCLCDRETTAHKLGIERHKQQALTHISLIEQASTNSRKKDLRRKYGVKEGYNPFFTLEFDPFRSSPVECLHTILLGPYKYLTRALMNRLQPIEKDIITEKIKAFPLSGLSNRPTISVCRHFGSLHGRDFKVFAQICLFVLWEHLTESEREIWLSLSKVFQLAYCQYFHPNSKEDAQLICNAFLCKVKRLSPDLLKKPKFHLLLHLPDNMEQFGPTACFNTERCEHFNGLVRDYNLHGNKHACSRDIVTRFARVGYIQQIPHQEGVKSVRHGSGLKDLIAKPQVQKFLYGATMREVDPGKGIYQPGRLRKDTNSTIKLRELLITVGTATHTIRDWHLDGLSMSTDLNKTREVHPFTAVVDRSGKIINTGDKLAYKANKVEYGELKACFSAGGKQFCVVQPFEPVEYKNTPINNEFDCPLLTLEPTFVTVPAHQVFCDVSIIHECTKTCSFTKTPTSKTETVEREQIPYRNASCYKHDFSNNVYCLNIYCTSQLNLL